MDKVVASAAEAVADIADGASISISGFGLSSGVPNSLLAAAVQQGARNLCLVANTVGGAVAPLIESGQVSRLIVSFVSRPNIESAAGSKAASGEIEFEVVPQGTLVERLRAGGAGLAGVYTPTGVGTPIAEHKEVRFFDGKPFLFEPAIKVDYAFVTAYRADRLGNCEFRGSSQHFNPSFAKGAQIAIVEVDEIVEPGEIDPHRVGLPSCFVPAWSSARSSRIAPPSVAFDGPPTSPAPITASQPGHEPSWPSAPPRCCPSTAMSTWASASRRWSRTTSAAATSPSTVKTASSATVRPPRPTPSTFLLHDAGGGYVTPKPGMAVCDSVTAFEMVRSGKIDVVCARRVPG